jgi:hydrogenase nickel incorporation protein HypB
MTIERKVLEKNDTVAARNRAVFAERDIFVINLVSSPGSGKTSILERTLEHLRHRINIGVIEGDIQTDIDARRVAAYGVPVVQIATRGACHLEAQLVSDALSAFHRTDLNILIIENVGNLVCPAGYDLGEDKKVVVVSTTEGDDKPLKYPTMFKNSSALVINKMDLVPYLTSNPEQLKQNALLVNPGLEIFETSCTTEQGIREWCNWLLEQVQVHDEK